jgi:hypothetical protein
MLHSPGGGSTPNVQLPHLDQDPMPRGKTVQADQKRRDKIQHSHASHRETAQHVVINSQCNAHIVGTIGSMFSRWHCHITSRLGSS